MVFIFLKHKEKNFKGLIFGFNGCIYYNLFSY